MTSSVTTEKPLSVFGPNVVASTSCIKQSGWIPRTSEKNVRRHLDFKEALANHDIAEAQMLGDSRRGFLRPRFVEVPSVE